MPYYRWTGIDLIGTVHKGTSFARCPETLEKMLQKEAIGLMSAYKMKASVSAQAYTNALMHLSSLVKAHVRIHTALSIVSTTLYHPYLKACFEDVTSALKEGISLSAALAMHDIFDESFKAMVVIGEKTGNLAHVFEHVVEHTKKIQELKARVKSSLIMPALTFFFFFCMVVVMFFVVIPRFEYFLTLSSVPLPYATHVILKVSAWLRSWSCIVFCCTVVMIGGSLVPISRTVWGRCFHEKIILRLPGIAFLVTLTFKIRLFYMLHMLLTRGVPLHDALTIGTQIFTSTYMKRIVHDIKQELEKGSSLSEAVRKSPLTDYELDMLLTLGESSELLPMIQYIAELYEQRLYYSLQYISTIVQPLLLVILGILVAGIMACLYIPLLTLSSIVQ